MTLIVSEKSGPNGLLLVVTDEDILGKTFEEGKIQLDLTKEFYKGEEKSKEEVKELFVKARDIHLTGKEAVAVGVELSYVESDHIIYVEGVPHAQVVIGE